MVEVAEERLAAELENLLERANHGEVIVVTRDDQPIVEIRPADEATGVQSQPHDVNAARDAVRRIREYARRHPVPDLPHDEIKSWIEEGRQ